MNQPHCAGGVPPQQCTCLQTQQMLHTDRLARIAAYQGPSYVTAADSAAAFLLIHHAACYLRYPESFPPPDPEVLHFCKQPDLRKSIISSALNRKIPDLLDVPVDSAQDETEHREGRGRQRRRRK